MCYNTTQIHIVTKLDAKYNTKLIDENKLNLYRGKKRFCINNGSPSKPRLNKFEKFYIATLHYFL
jgi:hypothetical protein